VNREYRRGLSTHPCESPVLKISEVEMFPTFTSWGRLVRKSRTKLHRVGSDPGPEFNDELGGYYGVEC
jgi:hypothetical protein